MTTSLVETVRLSTVPVTVSAPASTITIDGTTETQIRTSTIPPVTVTESIPGQGEVQTGVDPASTIVLTQEISSPPETVTALASTITAPGETVTASGSAHTTTVSAEQETATAFGPTQIFTAPNSAETVTEPGQISTETMTQLLNTCAVTLAPSATISPKFNPDSDLTWGCSPGTNCDPPKPNLCEAWTDSPLDEFTCQAAHCKPVKALVLGGGKKDGKFPLNEGYFVLDPSQFGLGFDIFTKTDHGVDIEPRFFPPQQQSNVTSAPCEDDQPHQNPARDLDNHVIPAACFETCNNAYLEAQSTGKGPGLCRPESAFMVYYMGCDSCVDLNAEQTTGMPGLITSSSYLSAKFSQFLRHCKVSGDIHVGLAPAETSSASSTSSAPSGGSVSVAATSRAAVGATTSRRVSDVSTSTEGFVNPGAAFMEQKTASAQSHTPSSTVKADVPTEPGLGLPSSISASAAERKIFPGDAELSTEQIGVTSPGTSISSAAERTSLKTEEASSTSIASGSPPAPAPSAAPASIQTAGGNTIASPDPLSPASIEAPLPVSPETYDTAMSNGLHSSTEIHVSSVSRPTRTTVVVAGSPVQRPNSLRDWGGLLIATVAFLSYV